MLFTEAINMASSAPGSWTRFTFNTHCRVINIAFHASDISSKYVYTTYLPCYVLIYVTVTVFMILIT